MPSLKSTKADEEKHEHYWIQSQRLNQKSCSGCKALLVSQQEYDLRAKEWDEYFAYVRTTDGFLRFQKIRQAWKEKDLILVRELAEEAKKAYEADQYIADKPDFPDPRSWNLYVIV